MQTLLYGISDETSRTGPYVTDGAGNALVPVVQNGYYLLIDRYAGADSNQDILERYSFNFTLAVYDADTNTLYFFKLDT